jgi:hypothetical protein
MASSNESLTVFDHRDPGTMERLGAADGRIATANLLPVPGNGRRMVVLAAHPDDETLGAGELIAMAARNGARLDVIVASDGDASHPASPTRTPAQLAGRRRAEVVDAIFSLDLAATVIQNEALSDLHGDEAILTESFLAHFRRPYETFPLESSPVQRAIATDRAAGAPA